ncbi:MAG: inorganic phosphate transporter [Acidobacteria bacterium]|nr:inorganic phosphate transporter [Acidobacteriota bacterium]
MISSILLLVVCFVAYANGANDNFKGVATLFGSRTTGYRSALYWASSATFAGAIASVWLSDSLVRWFSAQDILPAGIAGSPEFLVSVALGAAATVMLATLLGFPISTTHSLTGALLGAGLMAVGRAFPFTILAGSSFIPLALSPLLALGLGWALFQIVERAADRVDVSDEVCLCVEDSGARMVVPTIASSGVLALEQVVAPHALCGTGAECRRHGARRIFGIRVSDTLDYSHYASAGLVSFARGLNDTPKIAALLVLVDGVQPSSAFLVVAVAMMAGGLLNARRVAETMSLKITKLSHRDGFAANMVTAFLVLAASRLGMPVSTTHTSVGSLVGVGAAKGALNNRTASGIAASWVMTVPVACLIAACTYFFAAGPMAP